MTRKNIKEIIETFIQNDVPDQVRESFEKWMLDPESYQEKNDALESVWDEFGQEIPSEDSGTGPAHDYVPEIHAHYSASGMPGHAPGAGRSVFSRGVEPVSSVLRDAARLSGQERHTGRKIRFALWLSSAAAVFFAVLSAVLFVSGGTEEVHLASSAGSKASFVLPDGSKVWLNSGSSLFYRDGLGGRKRVVRLEGEGFFDVAKDSRRPFMVKACDLDITALGTEFTVSAYSGTDICTYLQEGRVLVSGPRLEEGVTMSPGQAMIFSRDDMKYTLKRVKASNHTSWIKDRLDFYNTSLYDIFETLRHWYNVDIRLSGPPLALNTCLSLTVRQEPLEEIVQAIAELVPYTVETDNAGSGIIYITLSKN